MVALSVAKFKLPILAVTKGLSTNAGGAGIGVAPFFLPQAAIKTHAINIRAHFFIIIYCGKDR